MVTRTEKDFNLFMSQLKETTVSLDFYTNFHKCYSNIQTIEIHLTQIGR